MKYFCTIQSMHSIRNLLRFRCRAGNLRQSSVCKTGIRVCIIVCCLCLTLHLLRTAFRALFIGKPQGDEQFEWLRRNRDVRQYILPEVNTTLLSPRMSCYDRLRLLILVASAPGNSEHRQAIRDTWGYAVPIHEARLLFFLGHDGNGRPLLTTESVLSEAQKYGDIVVEDFIDSYHNLTLKSVFMLKWTLKCCKSVPYVLKTDDDMLINVRALLQELENSKYRPSQPLIIGRIQEGSLPYRDRLSKCRTLV
ncbi:beta-1,3-galactosyltransferase 1-like, partial [Cryptotermes secundus]|uniref:beta-1,3-galactosyltransferase 1-like n=1 Tax=Cryptotermes secundus TaxID=105785 RepID=UPI001454CA10